MEAPWDLTHLVPIDPARRVTVRQSRSLKFMSAVSIPPLRSAEGARTIVQVSGVHQKEVDILFLRKVLISIQASQLRQ